MLDTDLRVLSNIGSSGSGEGELDFPIDISCDSTCRVYIAGFLPRTGVFTGWSFLRTIGHRGPCP